MTETEYLYGVQVKDFLYLPYKQAVEFKLEKGRELHRKLYGKEDTHEDRVRLHKVQKAIMHNEKLIKEWEQ